MLPVSVFNDMVDFVGSEYLHALPLLKIRLLLPEILIIMKSCFFVHFHNETIHLIENSHIISLLLLVNAVLI